MAIYSENYSRRIIHQNMYVSLGYNFLLLAIHFEIDDLSSSLFQFIKKEEEENTGNIRR